MPIDPIVNYTPSLDDLDILFLDDGLVIVNKPSGLLSVPGKSSDLADCLESRVRQEVKGALVIHRLDMDTSGVMVFARTKAAQRHLNKQFEERIPKKKYIARVLGCVQDDDGVIDLPLCVDWPNRPLQKVDHDQGKPAITHWRVLVREEAATRMELAPLTGRSHQLRVHMLELGHPILGDRFYGVGNQAPRLNLHAQSLGLYHPERHDWIEFEADTPF